MNGQFPNCCWNTEWFITTKRLKSTLNTIDHLVRSRDCTCSEFVKNIVIRINAFMSNAFSRSRRLEVFCEKGVLKSFAKFTGKHLRQSLFLIKLQTLGLQIYEKRVSGTGVFLWILRNFEEHLLLQNTSGGTFWSSC